jgi:hypothetical protein
MKYATLHELTPRGLAAFKLIFSGQLDEHVLETLDRDLVEPIRDTGPFFPQEFETAKEMARAVLDAMGGHHIAALTAREGLWAWLTFVLRDVLFPASDGKRKVGEIHRWLPSDPGDYQKGQRHLVRMPVILLSQLGDDADHLLCGPPRYLPDIREQLTSQQDMFHPTFQKAARWLYFDDKTDALKRGSGSKGGGSPRRLAEVRKQFDVTWDLYDLNADRFLGMLPREFERFAARS